MRLKNIKLAGFKSFVDPTTIPFDKDLVAIVGPNGCGKSNVIDAIRWVMGEASAKALRGESMADVIFNGSTGRKALDQASVTLTFDNADGTIGGEYASYAEIGVKRMAYRDGSSDYFLNNTKCRRKDIIDIFLGTGLGSRSYSVIEQGMISRFIEAKPDDLRVYLEEAAGVSKYKERRKETESRLKQTRENLERVHDLSEEIGAQLGKLERQAAAAREYQALKIEEDNTRAELMALEWRALSEQLKTFSSAILRTQTDIEKENAALQSLQVSIENSRESQVEFSENFHRDQQAYYQLGAELGKLEQKIAFHKEKLQQWEEDLARLASQESELQEAFAEDKEKLAELLDAEKQYLPQYEAAKKSESISQLRYQEAEDALLEWQSGFDELLYNEQQALKKAEILQNNIRHSEAMSASISARLTALEKEKSTLQAQPLDTALLRLREEEKKLKETVEKIKSALAQQSQEEMPLVSAVTTLKKNLSESQVALQEAQSEYRSLTILQEAALYKAEGADKAWIEKQGLTALPRLGKLLQVEAGYEKAVETVLGHYVESIVVDSIAQLKTVLSESILPSVQFTSTPYSAPMVQRSNARGEAPLIDKVTTSLALPLLKNIYCVDTLEKAFELLPLLSGEESVVTLQGVWLSQYFLRTPGTAAEGQGVIEREKRIQTLRTEIETLKKNIAALEENIAQQEAVLTKIQTEKKALLQEESALDKSLSMLSLEYRLQSEQLSHNQARHEALEQESAEKNKALTLEEAKRGEARSGWTEALAEKERLESERASLEKEGSLQKNTVQDLRETFKSAEKERHELELQYRGLLPQIEGLKKGLSRIETQLQGLQSQKTLLEKQRSETDDPETLLQDQLQEKLAAHREAETALGRSKQRMEQSLSVLRELEERKEDVEEKVDALKEQLQKTRLDGNTFEVRQKTYEEQLLAAGLSLEEILARLPQEAKPFAWSKKIESIVDAIGKLGAINLAAIEECGIQSERKTYLDSQYQDLIQAVTTLEEAIAKIDKETRDKFKETFNQVNESFGRLFPKIFGGGEAQLALVGEDLLDTGVSVMARPPGKKNTTIHLLSGGEKALTAVALVFAIFELNPSPFCVLDEVDAPLDDANVGRFCSLVKEMSDKVQFIFITHNKIAMETAEELIGVTMKEPGVSRIVAVDMQTALSMVEA
jgi:chromosome segregation protein